MAAVLAAAFKPRNRLLAALPAEDMARLRPRLEPVEVALRQVIQVPNEPITSVYFPGLAALFSVLRRPIMPTTGCG